MKRFVINDERTARFVAESVGSTDCACHSSIGLEEDGKIVAGATFDNFTGSVIFMHFSTCKNNWCVPRSALKLIFSYLFDCLHVRHVRAAIKSTNAKVIRLAELVGFRLEATLKDSYLDGADMLIYSVGRPECRFLIERNHA